MPPASVPALAELQHHYHQRDLAARAWRAGGGTVVGYVGADVPRELLVAAGLLPVRLSGDPRRETPRADAVAGAALEPVTRSMLDRLLDGAYAFVDDLVIGHDQHAHAQLFYTLRELQRVEPVAGLPEFHFFDLLHLPYRTSAIYNRQRARELLAVAERWAGRGVSADDLRDAVRLLNDNRRLLQRLATLRRQDPPRLMGAQALALIGAGMLMPIVEHTRLLEDVLAHADDLPPCTGVRVFVTGSGHDTLQFYEWLESRGAVVVGEDHDWGDRSYADLADESADPIDAVVDRLQLGAPASAKRGIVERATYTANAARAAGAEVAMCVLRAGDDGPAWDASQQRRRLEAHAIPLLVLPAQPYWFAETPGLVEQVDAFLGTAAGRTPAAARA